MDSRGRALRIFFRAGPPRKSHAIFGGFFSLAYMARRKTRESEGTPQSLIAGPLRFEERKILDLSFPLRGIRQMKIFLSTHEMGR